ncbi:MAG: macro domain-containing protein [Planctomycetota bacterium]
MPSLRERLRIFQGDITSLEVDAVVTAANAALMGGSGVDGAVHDAAGPELVQASMQLAPCPAGQARLTASFGLSGRFVIHAVGPIFSSLKVDGPILSSAYRSSLGLASLHHVESIAFPCISTGVYRFPPDSACEIACDAVIQWLEQQETPHTVTFCCFEDRDVQLYRDRLRSFGVE